MNANWWGSRLAWDGVFDVLENQPVDTFHHGVCAAGQQPFRLCRLSEMIGGLFEASGNTFKWQRCVENLCNTNSQPGSGNILNFHKIFQHLPATRVFFFFNTFSYITLSCLFLLQLFAASCQVLYLHRFAFIDYRIIHNCTHCTISSVQKRLLKTSQEGKMALKGGQIEINGKIQRQQRWWLKLIPGGEKAFKTLF